MRIKNMTFDDNGEGVEPKTLTVEINLNEAIWIAKNAGRQQGESPHSEIYSSLVCDFFNRFWEDGLSGADEGVNIKVQRTAKLDEVIMHKGLLQEIISAIDETKNVSLVKDLKKL